MIFSLEKQPVCQLWRDDPQLSANTPSWRLRHYVWPLHKLNMARGIPYYFRSYRSLHVQVCLFDSLFFHQLGSFILPLPKSHYFLIPFKKKPLDHWLSVLRLLNQICNKTNLVVTTYTSKFHLDFWYGPALCIEIYLLF